MAERLRSVRVERNTPTVCESWEATIRGSWGEYCVEVRHHRLDRPSGRGRWPASGRFDHDPPPPDVSHELTESLVAEVRRAMSELIGAGP